ncbi:hypothetical protein GZL_00964 [Streptomyces sp. 769]|nr:hypothetical protein GZL_00964 [Streptomyces sp. 769]
MTAARVVRRVHDDAHGHDPTVRATAFDGSLSYSV